MAICYTRKELEKADPELAKVIQQIPDYDPWLLHQPGQCFDTEIARWAIGWFPKWLKFVKGAKAGEPFELDWWQQAIVGCLWGFRDADGSRRFNVCFLYVAKKNGKSAFTAGLILLVLATDGESAMDLYSVAAAGKQTKNVWDHVLGMARGQPAFSRWQILGGSALTSQKGIADRASMSTFMCLTSDADTVDGAEPQLAIVDELHRHKNAELMDLLRRGTRSRANGLTVITTTADYNRESACNNELKRALMVRSNQGKRAAPGFAPSYLPCVWKAEPEDDYKKPSTWRKANPGLGSIKSESAMREGLQEVKDNPSLLNLFLRLDLNIVTDTATAWLDPAKWDACEPERTLKETVSHLKKLERDLRGEECYMGVDLSRKIDQTAEHLWFPKQKVVLCRYWIPEETATLHEQKYGIPYSLWARHGLITIVPGGIIEYPLVEASIKDDVATFDVQDVGYDPWKFERTRQNVITSDVDVDLTAMAQGAKTLGEATIELEGDVVAGLLRHGGHPVLAYNARNVTVRIDGNKNIVPCKKTSKGAIDGILALVMGYASAIINPAGPSLDDIYSSGETLEA